MIEHNSFKIFFEQNKPSVSFRIDLPAKCLYLLLNPQ